MTDDGFSADEERMLSLLLGIKVQGAEQPQQPEIQEQTEVEDTPREYDLTNTDEGQDEIRFDRYSSLRDALAQLPEEQREVLVLRHVAGLTPLEIARHMNKTESSVHGLHHRGRGTLQAALRELGAVPVVQAGSAA